MDLDRAGKTVRFARLWLRARHRRPGRVGPDVLRPDNRAMSTSTPGAATSSSRCSPSLPGRQRRDRPKEDLPTASSPSEICVATTSPTHSRCSPPSPQWSWAVTCSRRASSPPFSSRPPSSSPAERTTGANGRAGVPRARAAQQRVRHGLRHQLDPDPL